MINRGSIQLSLAAALFAAGCASQAPLPPTPLAQDELDQFLANGRDARYYGITTYQDSAGARYEFANRVHPDRVAQKPMISPRDSSLPLVRAKTAAYVEFNLLLDSTARQNWLMLASAAAMDYVPFQPPSGEYADHVVADIPGYAGVANKIVLDSLHVESPIFLVAPARGRLGPLARADALAIQTQAVMGAALMRSFAFIRCDFANRAVFFSTTGTYAPPMPSAVVADLPLRDWRGRPAVEGRLGGVPILLVIDTAGDFDLSVPPEDSAANGALELDGLAIDDVAIATHAALGLPEKFPARLGLGVLARYAVTLDFKRQRVWLENPNPSRDKPAAPSSEESAPVPVHYRGIER